MSTPDSPPSASRFSEQEKEEAANFLRSLLNKNFRVTTTDSRMFWGTFKCTDPVSLPFLTPPPPSGGGTCIP